MADDLLKELLTSPLDSPKRPRRRDRDSDPSAITAAGEGEKGTERLTSATWMWGLAAAVAGATIVLVGYVVARDPVVVTEAPTTTTTTAIAAPDGSPSGLPVEYTPVGDRLGMRVERILVRSDGVFITLTTVVENSLEPEQSAGFQGGLWTLVLSDGRRITSTNESFDALAPGTVSVFFPPSGIVAEDIEALEINGVSNRLTNVLTARTVEPLTLPADGTTMDVSLEPMSFDIDVNIELIVDAFTMSTGGAQLAWSVSGEANAALFPVLTIEWSDGTTTTMTTRTQTSGFNFFHPSVASPMMRRGGEAAFDPPNVSGLSSALAFEAALELQTTWASYRPTVTSIPVEGAQIAVVTGN